MASEAKRRRRYWWRARLRSEARNDRAARHWQRVYACVGYVERGDELAWLRAEARTQETDWLAVRQQGIRYEIGSAIAGEKINPNALAGDRAVAMAQGRASVIRSTHIRVMASLMLRLDGTVRDAR